RWGRRKIRWWAIRWSKEREAERNTDTESDARSRWPRRRDCRRETERRDRRGCANAGHRACSPRVDHWATPRIEVFHGRLTRYRASNVPAIVSAMVARARRNGLRAETQQARRDAVARGDEQ